MGLADFSPNDFLTFFAVLVRFSVLVAVLPFLGDKAVHAPVKILLALGITVCLYPLLKSDHRIDPEQAAIWGASAFGIARVLATEALIAIAIGFTARLTFEAIQIGGNLAGNLMGYASASMFDPHSESNTQVVERLNMSLAMLVFLTLDGHHLMLRAALDSYRYVGLGTGSLGGGFNERLVGLSSVVLSSGFRLAAPLAISLFGLNIVYAVMAKAMPQLNILVLSFSVSALVGLLVMFLSFPEFMQATRTLLGGVGDKMVWMMRAMQT